MKTATLRILCKNQNDANAVVSQLNQLVLFKNNNSLQSSKFINAASKEGTTGIMVTLVNCTKKEAVTILHDILCYYKCFEATGHAYCNNPLTKREEKIAALPIKDNGSYMEMVEHLQKINDTCRSKFTLEDLKIC